VTLVDFARTTMVEEHYDPTPSDDELEAHLQTLF